MHALKIIEPQELTMSSREISELTGKRHRDVNRDIKSMLTEMEIDARKFARIYLDQRNRQQSEYLLPKDLTLTLVAGYNIKLRHRIVKRWLELETPSSQAELILKQAHQLVLQEQRLQVIESKQDDIDQKLKQLDPETGYRTITAHCRIVGIKVPLSYANRMGRKAATLCKKKGMTVGAVADERFGKVNSYPIKILNEVFSDANET